jgi:hypothetical protein
MDAIDMDECGGGTMLPGRFAGGKVKGKGKGKGKAAARARAGG